MELSARDKQKLNEIGAKIEKRRLFADDLTAIDVQDWYICTGPALRKAIQGWLPEKKIIFESFDY